MQAPKGTFDILGEDALARRLLVGQDVVGALGRLQTSSARKGLDARSRPSVVTPMWPGKTVVSSG